MDRPSQRSTTLDPTTAEGHEPASPDPEEPDDATPALVDPDTPGTRDTPDTEEPDGEPEAEPAVEEPGAEERDGTESGAEVPGTGPGAKVDGEPGAGEPDAGEPDADETSAGESGAEELGADETDADETDAEPEAEPTVEGSGAEDPGVGSEAASAAAESAGEESDGEPEAESAAEGSAAEPGADESGSGPDAEAGDGEAVDEPREDAADEPGEGAAGAEGAGEAEAEDRADGPAVAGDEDDDFRAPVDVQVIALALVEAATEDAAKVSPAPTAEPVPTVEPATTTDPAPVTGAPAVPPFPMPVPPESPARDPLGSARDTVVRRARGLRAWWAGEGRDGESSAEVARRNRAIGIGAAAAVVVLLVVYVVAAFAQADVVPRGTTVAGAELGGQRTAEAEATLSDALEEAAAAELELVAGEASTSFDPVAAGLSVDVSATADSLTGFSLSPARMWQHLFGAGPAAPVLDVTEEAFASAVGGLEDAMAVAPVNGAIEFATDATPTVTPPRAGTRIDPEAAGRAIMSSWLVVDGPIELPTRTVPPEITQAATDAALVQAEKIVSGPVEVNVGGQRAELPPKVLASAASFVEKDGELALRFDGATLTRAIVERTDNLLTTAEGAQFSFASGRPEVVGGQLGTTLDDKPTRNKIRAAALGDERTATLEVVQQTPENSTQALRAMGVEEVVAEFSTPLTSDYVRTQNLIRGAEMITGDLIRPGETYSLVEALSPITLANGYVNSGMIIGGQHIDGVGGGLSQMATTTYNAAMIAGFEDVEHHPHSYWFERYPAGREATIAVGSKDMKVRNNTPYGAVMQSWVADNQLHVRIWSTKHLKNTWTDGPKRNIVPVGRVTSSGAGCVSYPGGQPGFTITVDRKVERIDDGEVVIERSYTTTYRPDHAMSCVAAAPPPAADGGDTAPEPPGPDD